MVGLRRRAEAERKRRAPALWDTEGYERDLDFLTAFAVDPTDYPLVQAAVFIMALAVIVANLVADVLYAYFDPTVSTSGGGAA